MGSQIDASQPIDGVPASKSIMRANLAAAKSELEHGGFFVAAHAGGVERTGQGKLRELAASVTDFGATGDGITDDTAAFQAALDAINDSGRPGTLFVPAAPGGSYRLRSITLEPKVAIRVVGERSRLQRLDAVTQLPGYSFSDGRLFNISGNASNPRDALGYYGRVTFEGIVFDGNRDNQVLPSGEPWARDFGLQWFHAVNVEADDAQPWRQPVWFLDCDFESTNGEGISLFRNASVHAERCRFYACFRGGITVVGGWVELIARDCISDDPLDTAPHGMYSGLYFEYEPEGYQRTNAIHVDGWTFRQGDINVVTHGDALQVSGQTVAPLLPGEKNDCVLRGLRVMQGNQTGQVKFYNSGEANFLVSDSIFYGGRQDDPDALVRRTMIDGRNIEFHSCVFVASNNGRPVDDPPPAFYSAVMIRDFNENTHGRQRHRFLGCRFLLDETCHGAAPVHAVATDFINNARRAAAPFAAGFQPPFISFDDCTFGYLKYYPDRDSGQAPVVRKFDYFLEPRLGTAIRFAHCDGYGVRGFKLEQGQAGFPGYYEFVGGNYAVDEAMFEAGMGVGPPAETLVVRFSGFWTEDRWNHFLHTEPVPGNWDWITVYGGREVMVASDPTATAPVSISNSLLLDVVRPDNLYQVRLEGTPVVPGTLTITNLQKGHAIEDDGAGDLVDAANGATVVGSIDYGSGWATFSWPAGKIPSDLDHIVHAYQHDNHVPGFRGDVAVLKSDPLQRWRCTTASPTAATWTAS